MSSSDYVTKMRQFVCGLQGHDSLLEFGRGRLSLKCVSCGHETPGWDIEPPSRSAAQSTPSMVPIEHRGPAIFAAARRLHDAFPQM